MANSRRASRGVAMDICIRGKYWLPEQECLTRVMQYEHKGNTLSDAVSFLLFLHIEHKGNTLSDAVPILSFMHM